VLGLAACCSSPCRLSSVLATLRSCTHPHGSLPAFQVLLCVPPPTPQSAVYNKCPVCSAVWHTCQLFPFTPCSTHRLCLSLSSSTLRLCCHCCIFVGSLGLAAPWLALPPYCILCTEAAAALPACVSSWPRLLLSVCRTLFISCRNCCRLPVHWRRPSTCISHLLLPAFHPVPGHHASALCLASLFHSKQCLACLVLVRSMPHPLPHKPDLHRVLCLLESCLSSPPLSCSQPE
jgi:hypothetical protein